MASPSDALSSPTSDRSKTSATDAFKGSYQDWATKIRQTQNRIDAEDEAEQKRLRDEIFAARQARRSRPALSVNGSPRSPQQGFISPPLSPTLDFASSPRFAASFKFSDPDPPLSSSPLAQPTAMPIRPPSGTQTEAVSLANRNNALEYSARFTRPNASSGTPISLSQFMGARTDVRGPVLTKQRVDEIETRPPGWEAAEERARQAEGFRPAGGLAGLMGGGRALPGMVSKDKLDANRNSWGSQPVKAKTVPLVGRAPSPAKDLFEAPTSTRTLPTPPSPTKGIFEPSSPFSRSRPSSPRPLDPAPSSAKAPESPTIFQMVASRPRSPVRAQTSPSLPDPPPLASAPTTIFSRPHNTARPPSPLKRASTISSPSPATASPSTVSPVRQASPVLTPRNDPDPRPVRTSARSNDDAAPPSPLQSTKVPTSSLARLAGSNIVRQRVLWSQERESSSTPSSPAPSTTVPTEGLKKKPSVVARWGRDEPASSPSQIKTASPAASSSSPRFGGARPASPTKRWGSETVNTDAGGSSSRQNLAPVAQVDPAPTRTSRPLPTPPSPVPGGRKLPETPSAGAGGGLVGAREGPASVGAPSARQIVLPALDKLPRVDVARLSSDLTAAPSPRPSFATSPITSVVSLASAASLPLPLSESSTWHSTETLVFTFGKDGGKVVWFGADALAGSVVSRQVDQLARGGNAVVVRRGRVSSWLAESIAGLGGGGGKVVVRKGTRRMYDPKRPAVHRVRTLGKAVVIEEEELSAGALVSSEAAVVVEESGSVVVWEGRWSSTTERTVASEHARFLSGGRKVKRLREGADDETWRLETFGPSATLACSNQWRHRAFLREEAILWRIDAKSSPPVSLVRTTDADNSLPTDRVGLLDTGLERFVLVPPPARHLRTDIALAVRVARDLSRSEGMTRPFRTAAHVLVFPTVVPVDLVVAARHLDLTSLNDGVEPRKMNLVSLDEAEERLATASVGLDECSDHECLPLGVGPRSLLAR